MRKRNLIIVHTPEQQRISDWLTVAEKINARAPDIRVRIVDNGRRNRLMHLWQRLRPTFIFSASPLLSYRPKRGTVYRGIASRIITKEVEIARMREAGLPVPETVAFTPGLRLSGAPWEPYVIVKPYRGKQGRMIRLVRTEDLPHRHGELTRDGTVPMLVQQFVDHVDGQGRPCGYRVLTLFGHELFATLKFWTTPRESLEQIASDPKGVIASNASTAKKDRCLTFEEDVLALARATTRAFPEIPVLGVDIIRETGTGKLYITETNPSGYVWHFSSVYGEKIFPPDFRASMYAQFNALDRIADILIEKTRAEAK